MAEDAMQRRRKGRGVGAEMAERDQRQRRIGAFTAIRALHIIICRSFTAPIFGRCYQASSHCRLERSGRSPDGAFDSSAPGRLCCDALIAAEIRVRCGAGADRARHLGADPATFAPGAALHPQHLGEGAGAAFQGL